MNIKEISKPVTAKSLNESLARKFGKRIALEQFTLEQLENVRNKLRTTLSQVETNESFNVVQSESYQKNKLFLDVLNAEIVERTEVTSESKPDFADIDGDGDKKEPMKKAAKDKEDGSEEDTPAAGLSAKQKKLPAGLQKAIAGKKGKTESVVKEGAEDQAELVMAAKDMVNRVTGWMEDTAEMQTESMLELADAIRDEQGQEKSDAFVQTVKSSLEGMYTAMESTRQSLTQGVGILTGEAEPATDMGVDPEADMEPTVDMEDPAMDADLDVSLDAAGAAAGGDEEAGRAKRESVKRNKKAMLESSRRLGTILSKKNK
jgi:hypothetical protein|tara:strand:- start:5710 stop:6663 length:954 start_codon:yes stop_codon:yes gene_type:complete